MPGVISYGGEESTIIPHKTELKVSYRAPTEEEIELLGTKVEACLNGASITTGCKVILYYLNVYRANFFVGVVVQLTCQKQLKALKH